LNLGNFEGLLHQVPCGTALFYDWQNNIDIPEGEISEGIPQVCLYSLIVAASFPHESRA